MANIDGLNSYKKGESGNSNGRPKGKRNRSTIVKEWLKANESTKNPITGVKESLSQEDIMTLALVNKARKGDVQAYKALMDSCYGSPTQSIDHTNDGDKFDGVGSVNLSINNKEISLKKK